MSTSNVTLAFVSATVDEVFSPGPISVPGLKVGDIVISITNPSVGAGSYTSNNWFEAVITVDDEIQQLVSNTTPATGFNLILVRKS